MSVSKGCQLYHVTNRSYFALLTNKTSIRACDTLLESIFGLQLLWEGNINNITFSVEKSPMAAPDVKIDFAI